MSTDSREFGLFIDGLRLERNISREDLCDGIISLSQYKRYLRGDTSIPNDKLVLLADRLKFSISDIHVMYNRKTDKQYKKISEIYKFIQSHKYSIALTMAREMQEEIILSEYNDLYLSFCLINAQHNLNMVSDIHVLQIYSDMIDYPNCVENESFNWVEFNILLQIVLISSKMDNYEPSNILYKLITSENFTLNFVRQEQFLPPIYQILAQILGLQSKFEEVIDVTDRAITFCLDHEISSALPHLLLLNAYANLDVGNQDKALISAKKMFMQLYIENKPNKMEQFKKSFENKFNMKLEDLILF